MNDSRILIEDIKWGWTNEEEDPSGDTGFRHISVKFKQNGRSRWLYNTYVWVPVYRISDDDLHEIFLSDAKTEEKMGRIYWAEISSFEGLYLSEYDEMIENIKEHPDHPAVPFIKFLISLYKCEDQEIDNYIIKCKGKNVDDIMATSII